MSQLYDPIRKLWVEATPEEKVRQKLIIFMIEKGGYPPGLIAVEISLEKVSPLPFPPQRRLDLLVYSEKKMKPLLLIECKSEGLDEKALSQLEGYNHYLQAPFIALVDAEKILVKDCEGRIYTYLPSYTSLVQSLSVN